MQAQADLTVVCGGGGLWGAAWMIGLTAGLLEAGVNIRTAGTFIGTSAGSVVGSQLTSGLTTSELYALQTDPARQASLIAPAPGSLEAMTKLMRQGGGGHADRRKVFAEIVFAAPPMSTSDRRAQVEGRLGLPSYAWPAQRLLITAVDVATGELVTFTAASEASLVDAVSASTAVPGVWPATEIGGRAYIDGGVWRTAENAHLAAGAERVLILSPMGMLSAPTLGGTGLDADVTALRASGGEVVVISADEHAIAAMAPNPLDPVTRKPAAEAGLRQGRDVAAAVRALL